MGGVNCALESWGYAFLGLSNKKTNVSPYVQEKSGMAVYVRIEYSTWLGILNNTSNKY